MKFAHQLITAYAGHEGGGSWRPTHLRVREAGSLSGIIDFISLLRSTSNLSRPRAKDKKRGLKWYDRCFNRKLRNIVCYSDAWWAGRKVNRSWTRRPMSISRRHGMSAEACRGNPRADQEIGHQVCVLVCFRRPNPRWLVTTVELIVSVRVV